MAMDAKKLAELRQKAMAKAAVTIAAEQVEVKNESANSISVLPDIGIPATHGNTDPVSGTTAVATIPAGAVASSLDSEFVDLTPQQFQVVEKIQRVRDLLITQDPQIETLLKQIHTALAKDPELVHFLKPEQIGTVVEGCMMITKSVVIATAIKKTTTVSGKKLSQLTLSDI